MQVRDPEAILAKLGERTLKIDSFFLRRTGFVANQTVLKLGEYTLNGVPATIGRYEAQFLAALTPTEMGMFSKFKTGVHLLILTFDDPDAHDVSRFPLRVALADIVSVPDRRDLCYLVIRYRSLPTEFVLFLGAYIEDLDARLNAWEKLANEGWSFSAETVLSAGLGYGAVLSWNGSTASTEITQFTTKHISLTLPPGTSPPEGACQLRLTYQKRALTLTGVFEGGGFLPEFHADWLDFVLQVRLRSEFQKRSESPA